MDPTALALINLLAQKINFDLDRATSTDIPAKCPFHKGGLESKPSFYLYVGPNSQDGTKRTGSAYCHTCVEGWGLSRLLDKLHINSALVDEMVELYDGAPRDESTAEERLLTLDFNRSLHTLPERFLYLWNKAPTDLLRQGFEKKTLKTFDVGFDSQRMRITFPIRDHHGNLVGVSGRTVVNDHPRYKIYKSEIQEHLPTYNIDRKFVVWGLNKFYYAARSGLTATDEPVIVCEGFKAAMWVWQCGYKNVVALLGAKLTEPQKFLLTSVTNKVIVFLDRNSAGFKGTVGMIRELKHEVIVSIAKYPTDRTKQQPDALTQAQVTDAIENALPYYKWNG